jgi:hypothetical protein
MDLAFETQSPKDFITQAVCRQNKNTTQQNPHQWDAELQCPTDTASLNIAENLRVPAFLQLKEKIK